MSGQTKRYLGVNYVAVPKIRQFDCVGCVCMNYDNYILFDACYQLRTDPDIPMLVADRQCRNAYTCDRIIWIKDTEKHMAEYIAKRLTS